MAWMELDQNIPPVELKDFFKCFACIYWFSILVIKNILNFQNDNQNFNKNRFLWHRFWSMSNPMSVNRKAKLQIRLQCPQRKHESTILCQAVYNIITQEISISLLNLFVCIKRWGIVTLTLNMNTWRVSHFSFNISGILWRIARYQSTYKKC